MHRRRGRGLGQTYVCRHSLNELIDPMQSTVAKGIAARHRAECSSSPGVRAPPHPSVQLSITRAEWAKQPQNWLGSGQPIATLRDLREATCAAERRNSARLSRQRRWRGIRWAGNWSLRLRATSRVLVGRLSDLRNAAFATVISRWALPSHEIEMALHGCCCALDVTCGEQVEKRASKYCECQRSVMRSRLPAPRA